MPILVFLLWIILNGRITLEIVFFGIGIMLLITLVAVRTIGYSLKDDWRRIKNLPVLFAYVLDLIYEILKAACLVARMVFRADEPDPVIVEFHSGLKTRFQNVLLANSITLTPGTITVFQEDDHFVIHALRREYAEDMEHSSFVKLLGKLH